MKNKDPVPVYIYIDIDRKARVDTLVKNIKEHVSRGQSQSQTHSIEPLAVFSVEVDKENSKFCIAYPSLHSMHLICIVSFSVEEVAINTLMGNPLPLKAVEAFSWHLSKAIVDILNNYPNAYAHSHHDSHFQAKNWTQAASSSPEMPKRLSYTAQSFLRSSTT